MGKSHNILTRTYRIWAGMKSRCRNSNAKDYPTYGGRGIDICKKWEKFSEFHKDMGDPPTNMYVIDRIDNDGDYELGNCRWASMAESCQNRICVKSTPETVRNIRQGYPQISVKELSSMYGITVGMIYHILTKRSWKNIT